VVADNKDLDRDTLVEERRSHWRTALEALKVHLGR
jgi:hypothetical protein